MKLKELIILAGGAGTRLREAIPGLPKPLAPIGNTSFIDILIRYYKQQGIQRFIFCLGHYQEIMIAHLQMQHPGIDKVFLCEDEPLGTGGAIKNAVTHCSDSDVVIINGDTYFDADLPLAKAVYDAKQAECLVLLKSVEDTGRFGSVMLSDGQRITGFGEKSATGKGLINAGVYILNRKVFLQNELPSKFSFEKEYLERYIEQRKIYGLEQQGFFIDIGIPEDLAFAQKQLLAYDNRLAQ